MSSNGISQQKKTIVSYVLVLPIVVALAWTALSGRVPLTYDEAYNYQHFASRGLTYVLFNYDTPNNHILFSALQSVFLTDDFVNLHPLNIRIPQLVLVSIVAGIACFKTSLTSITRLSAVPAFLFGSPLLTLYIFVARGYLLGTLLVVLAVSLIAKNKRLASSLSAALAIYACPTYIFALPGMALQPFYRRANQTFRQRLYDSTIFSVTTAMLVATLYFSVAEQVLKNRTFGTPFPTFGVFVENVFSSISSASALFESPLLGALSVALLIFVMIALHRSKLQNQYQLLAISFGFVALTALGLLLLTGISGLIPFPYLRSLHFVFALVILSLITYVLSSSERTVLPMVIATFLIINTACGAYQFLRTFGRSDPEAFPLFEQLTPTPLESAFSRGESFSGETLVCTKWMEPVARAYSHSKGFTLAFINELPENIPCVSGSLRPRSRRRDIYSQTRKGVICY